MRLPLRRANLRLSPLDESLRALLGRSGRDEQWDSFILDEDKVRVRPFPPSRCPSARRRSP